MGLFNFIGRIIDRIARAAINTSNEEMGVSLTTQQEISSLRRDLDFISSRLGKLNRTAFDADERNIILNENNYNNVPASFKYHGNYQDKVADLMTQSSTVENLLNMAETSATENDAKNCLREAQSLYSRLQADYTTTYQDIGQYLNEDTSSLPIAKAWQARFDSKLNIMSRVLISRNATPGSPNFDATVAEIMSIYRRFAENDIVTLNWWGSENVINALYTQMVQHPGEDLMSWLSEVTTTLIETDDLFNVGHRYNEYATFSFTAEFGKGLLF